MSARNTMHEGTPLEETKFESHEPQGDDARASILEAFGESDNFVSIDAENIDDAIDKICADTGIPREEIERQLTQKEL